jgi:hypothetical protein
MCRVLLATVLLSLAVASAATATSLQCQSMSGHAIDWWAAMKAPQLPTNADPCVVWGSWDGCVSERALMGARNRRNYRNAKAGHAYGYQDASATGAFVYSGQSVTDETSAMANTLNPLFASHANATIAWLFYNVRGGGGGGRWRWRGVRFCAAQCVLRARAFRALLSRRSQRFPGRVAERGQTRLVRPHQGSSRN